MKMQVKVLVILSLLICCTVELSNRHNQYYDYKRYDKPSKVSTGSNSVISIVAGIAFICLCAVGCVYCCRRFNNRNTNTFSSPNNQYNPNMNNFPQMVHPNPLPINHQNYQFNNQRVNASPPSNNTNESVNPYVVQRPSQINKACDLCNTKSKIGEQPRLMLSCPSQHFFHLTCVAFAFHPPNISCPQCREACLPKVTLFCSSCKESNVLVDISEFIAYSTGQLNIDGLKAKYGDLCPKCINL